MSRPLGLSAWLGGRSAVARATAATAALWTLVAFGAVGGTYAALRQPPAPPRVVIPGPTTGAEGVAQLYVATWLRGTPDPARPGVPSTVVAPRVTRTAALDAAEIAPGYWSVTVGAEVVTEVTATRYFRVPVVRAAGAYVVAAVPAEVAAPPTARVPVLAVGGGDAPAQTDAVAVAVTRFLGALLAGDGELARYIAPDAPIRAVRPAPYQAVVVADIASRSVPGPAKTLEVLVGATGTDAAGRVTTLAYPLRMAQRGGRWEVAAILDGPTLAEHQPSLAPTSTAVALPSSTSSVPPTTLMPNTSTTRPPAVTSTSTGRF